MTACSSLVERVEGVLEEGEILSPSRDHHLPEMPQSSLPPCEQMPEMPQPSLPRKEQDDDKP
jgi:hypothetical protein